VIVLYLTLEFVFYYSWNDEIFLFPTKLPRISSQFTLSGLNTSVYEITCDIMVQSGKLHRTMYDLRLSQR
jgi:hypothetical protein